MKGFIFLMLFSLMNFAFAGDLTEGGGGGRIKEPTITRGRMVMEKSNGIELRTGHLNDPIGGKSMDTKKPFREISNINNPGPGFVAGGDGSGGG